MPSGRKSLKDEIAVLQRYNELSVPYFKFIQEMLKSEKKDDRKWAAERLDKAFVKMVPQTVKGEGDEGEIILKVISYGDPSTIPLSAQNLSASPTPSD